MDQERKYDTGASLWFLVALLGLVVIVWTLILLRRLLASGKKSDDKVLDCECDSCRKSAPVKKAFARRMAAREASSTTGKIVHAVLYIGTVALVGVLAYHAILNIDAVKQNQEAEFDPWALLEVTQMTSQEDIRKNFRQISKKYHPDRPGGDEEMFIKVKKAYEVLTDDQKRAVYEKFGNPDGPQSFTVGLALPEELISGSNTAPVLLAYFIGLVVGIPALVYMCYKRGVASTAKLAREETMETYFHNITQHMGVETGLAELLCAAIEYRENIPLRPGDEDKKINDLRNSLISNELIHSKVKFDIDACIKGSVLLHAQMGRARDDVERMGSDLSSDLDYMLQEFPVLMRGLLEVAKAKRAANPVAETIFLSASVTQACHSNESLLQLPYIERESPKLRQLGAEFKVTHIRQILTSPMDKRLDMWRSLSFTKPQIEHIEKVCAWMPKPVATIEILPLAGNAVYPGTPFKLKITIKWMDVVIRNKQAEANKEKDALEKKRKQEEEEREERESRVAAKARAERRKRNLKRRARRERGDDAVSSSESSSSDSDSDDEAADLEIMAHQKEMQQKRAERVSGPPPAPIVHAPHFPYDRKDRWWVMASPKGANNIIMLEQLQRGVDKDESVIESQPISAPPQPGKLPLLIGVLSECYHGLNVMITHELAVNTPPETPIDQLPDFETESSDDDDVLDE